MNTSSHRIQRLITELQDLTYQRHSDRWGPLTEQIAQWLIEALGDDGHPLAEALVVLKDLHVGPSPNDNPKKFPKSYNQARRFFTPIPGSASPDHQRFWKLQLLLYTTAKSSYRLRLVELLQLSEHSVQKAVAKAGAQNTASVGLWSVPQYVSYLVQAVRLLDYPAPLLELSAGGRHLTYGATRAKLSPQHGQFMRLLLAHSPKPVPPDQLKKTGILYPAKAKERLVKCASRHGIELNIVNIADSYALLQ